MPSLVEIVIVATVYPLLGIIYRALVLKVDSIEAKAESIRLAHVTRELFDERTKHQDKALERIERKLGIMSPWPARKEAE